MIVLLHIIITINSANKKINKKILHHYGEIGMDKKMRIRYTSVGSLEMNFISCIPNSVPLWIYKERE